MIIVMTKIIMQDAIMMVETAVDLTLENITVLNAYAFQVKYLILFIPPSSPQSILIWKMRNMTKLFGNVDILNLWFFALVKWNWNYCPWESLVPPRFHSFIVNLRGIYILNTFRITDKGWIYRTCMENYSSEEKCIEVSFLAILQCQNLTFRKLTWSG